MKFRRTQERSSLRMNLTPLIDTVFLLLVFFMMTTTFDKQSQLQINLPEAKGAAVAEKVEGITLHIDAKGEYYINTHDNHVINNDLSTLTAALKKAAGGNDNPALVISADEQATHKAVVNAMEAARDLGFNRLSFAINQKTPTQ